MYHSRVILPFTAELYAHKKRVGRLSFSLSLPLMRYLFFFIGVQAKDTKTDFIAIINVLFLDEA